jgi:cytochrome c553
VTGTSAPSAAGAATVVPEGRLLASNCFHCHGTDGHPNGGFDSLAGDSASEIVKTLQEMAAKSPEDGGIMRAHATGYTDEQMWQLGTYFASQR